MRLRRTHPETHQVGRAASLCCSQLLLRGALVLNLSLALSYIGFWIIAAQQDLFWRADFSAFYTGWAMVRDGRGTQLYDTELQTIYQRQILEGRSFQDGLLPYVNPPHLTLPFVPLAWLPRPVAFLVWTVCQLALLAVLLVLLWRMARAWQPHERRLLVVSVLAFPPLLYTLMIGAFSLVLLVSLMLFYLALKNARPIQAGWWLVVATIKPQAAVTPAALLLGARRWQAILGAIIITLILAVVSIVGLGWPVWPGYLHILRAHSGLFGTYNVVPADMYNLKGTLALLLGNAQGTLINQVSFAALLVTAAFSAWLWRGAWMPHRPDFELRFAFTLLLGILFSPHLNQQDSLLLVAPALLFYTYLRQRDLPRGAYAAFVLLCPLVFLISEFFIRGKLGIQIPVLVMIVLAAWMGKALYDERKN